MATDEDELTATDLEEVDITEELMVNVFCNATSNVSRTKLCSVGKLKSAKGEHCLSQ